eukprot:7233944-Prymnesium_polylepis.1
MADARAVVRTRGVTTRREGKGGQGRSTGAGGRTATRESEVGEKRAREEERAEEEEEWGGEGVMEWTQGEDDAAAEEQARAAEIDAEDETERMMMVMQWGEEGSEAE